MTRPLSKLTTGILDKLLILFINAFLWNILVSMNLKPVNKGHSFNYIVTKKTYIKMYDSEW